MKPNRIKKYICFYQILTYETYNLRFCHGLTPYTREINEATYIGSNQQ